MAKFSEKIEGTTVQNPIAIATYPAVIGAVLSGLRKSKGLSQTELANSVGLNVSTWSRIENGESALTAEQLAMAAETLSTMPSEILRIVEEKIIKLKERGIEISAYKAGVDEITNAGSIPVTGTALLSALGPLSGGVAGGIVSGVLAGYTLYKRLKK